jgi:cyclophilin family peptidyl-prolyl cis-trans isomerase
LDEFPDELKYIFRIYPLLPVNDKASLAGQAALSAGSRGTFWEMHDLLVQEYQTWSILSSQEFISWVTRASEGVDPSPDQLERDLTNGKFADEMQKAYETGIEIGIPGVPLLLVNRTPYKLALDPINLKSAIRLEILKANQFEEYPPLRIDPSKEYFANLELNVGRIRLQLLPESAPLAVNSFVFLAEQGWYDDTDFHKVLPGLLVESGDPSGTGLGDAGYYYPTEIDPVQRFDRAGLVGMSSISPGIHSSRFFVTLAALPALDGRVTLFGRVIDGMELIETLDARDPAVDLMEASPVVIKSVSIEVYE